MDVSGWGRKEIGTWGERVAAEYLKRKGFTILDKNVARKTGELDLVAKKGDVLHIVEVKSVVCENFPSPGSSHYSFDPADNLHAAKVRKVVRTGEWYVAQKAWESAWQVDGVVVWIRRRDGVARVRYLPHLV